MKSKLKNLRENYTRDEVTVYGFETPRSGTDVHSASLIVDGVPETSVIAREQLIWDLDLNSRVEMLSGSHSRNKLLVKNIVAEFDEV